MSDQFLYVQNQPTQLAGAGAVSGATSVVLKSLTTIDGVVLTMANFGAIGFGTIEPGNGTFEEQICFTGITQNTNGTATLTGVSSVLFIAPYTQTSGLAKTHAGSTTFVISNTSGFYDRLTGKDDDETITGTWTFPTNDPTRAGIGSDVDTAVATAFVTLGQLSRVAAAGAANASTTVKGIVQLPTQAQVDAKTTTGSTGALLALTPDKQRSTLLSDYVVDTGAANAYVITPVPAISAYVAGQIFTFKVANTNTTASTLNVSVLGVKNIFRNGAAVGPGDIVANQIYLVEYDGTQFQILSGNTSAPTGTMQMFAGASAPNGWLACDASAISRTTYASLFAVIGTTFGVGNGTTTFNVPDMRGRVAVGVGTGTGGATSGTGLPTGGSALTAKLLAGWNGEETHTLTIPEMPAHTHDVTGFASGSGGSPAISVQGPNASVAIAPAAAISTGGSGSHNNIQPTMGLNFIIKT